MNRDNHDKEILRTLKSIVKSLNSIDKSLKNADWVLSIDSDTYAKKEDTNEN